MKTANPVTVLPTLIRPAQAPVRLAGSLAKGLALKILWRAMALVLAVALAQFAVRSIRSPAAQAHSGRPPLAADVAAGSSSAAARWASQGFRDEAPCELSGEPLECR
jgi:hypothetical protein